MASPSVGDLTENHKRGRKREHISSFGCNDDTGDKNNNVENDGIEAEVKTRPKRRVGHPPSLHDFYVEPVLKLTRQVKPKPPRARVCIINASREYSSESDSTEDHSVAKETNNQFTEKRLLPCTSGGQSIFHRKRNILTWMIDSRAIPVGAKLRYEKNRILRGVITVEGVVCTCCDETMSISRFISHAGGKYGEFDHLYLPSGISLLDCLLHSWRKEVSKFDDYNFIDLTGDNFNGDSCDICCGGGYLTCCDGCPSTFHPSCARMQITASGLWLCIYCLCKFCETNADGMLTCGLCDEKFHKPCRRVNAANMDCDGVSFCGNICHEIYQKLAALVGVRNEIGEGLSFTLLRRSDLNENFETNALKVECNAKLAVAYTVLEECFYPILDKRTGVDMIRNVVYNCGSNFKRLNYGGFFTAILEKNDEVISVASIRVHGNKLVEMPFIGTRYIYRRQGMCRRLLGSIESILSTFGVRKLVIPAMPYVLHMWATVFGFKSREESTRKTMSSISRVVFPYTFMLQKHIPVDQSTNRNLDRTTGRLM